MTIRSMVALAAVLASSSCSSTPPTAAGTTLLAATFAHDQGGPPAEMSGAAPTRHVSKVRVAGGAAEVEIRLDVVERPGGKYLHGVEVVAVDSGGGVLTARVPPGMSPVNRGTTEEVLASLVLMVDWRQEKIGSSSLRQSSIEIRGDGTASAP